MVYPIRPPGSGGDEDGDPDTNDSTSGGGFTAPDWLSSPKKFIRGVIYGDLLSGLAALLKPLFAGITIFFLGSNATEFAANSEQYGLADVPVYLWRQVGTAVSAPISAWFDALSGLIAAAVPSSSGPIEGLIAVIVTVIVVFVFFETARRVFWAIIDSIPILSGLIGGG